MHLTASDIIAILGAFFAGVAAVVTAWNNAKTNKVINQNQDQFGKLDAIHRDLDAAKLKEEQVAAALAVAKALAEKK